MASKYSFLLVMAFEGAVKMQDWAPLKNIIQVLFSFLAMLTLEDAILGQCASRVFECMADLILSEENNVPDEVSLQIMQVHLQMSSNELFIRKSLARLCNFQRPLNQLFRDGSESSFNFPFFNMPQQQKD